jgi:hypothetical protein
MDDIPFEYRPITGPDHDRAVGSITAETDRKARQFLLESFGGTLVNCSDTCLTYKYITPMSSAVSGRTRRQYWFWMFQFVEFYILHPVEFDVIVDINN